MKKIVTSALPLIIALSSFCQQNDSKMLSQNYLKKSKNQKTVAWILAGGGAALITTGLIIGGTQETSFDDAATGAAFIIAGAAPVIASIPLFIASGKNKKRAMNATAYFKTEKTYTFQALGKAKILFPALSLKIRL